ncbi:MAG: phage tail tape measure protein, partial [Pseudobutyrivibrio sp.]|nr:phage tail tape measure protein [Pseudobutyrivibrio sp.]
NSEIKNTEAQLRDVNKLLKLDPGNTDLIAQKHKLLGQAVDETKEKLAALKEAQRQADEALKNGTISQEQYDGLQREIIETEQRLKSLEEQANQSATALQKIAATGENLKDVGSKVEGVGKKLLPVTAAVTGLGTASVKIAADFEGAMSKVSAVSGATGTELDALSEKARQMGATTRFSASEAAEAMNYMAMAGWKTEDMLSGIEGVMNLAAASGEDLATTSDIVTDALTAFGLSAADSGHFADVLAAASSNANTNVSMMGETFKYCAPIAGALGFSVEDTAEAIGLMANAGIKGSQAGTSLRTIMNNLSSDVKICGANIGEVTIATTNADGSMRDLSDILADCRVAFAGLTESEQAAAAESLVGKNAMSGFLALMNAGEGDINKLSSAIQNCNGTAKNMADTMNNNLEGQLAMLKSALEELAISFGEILLPAVKNIVSGIQGFVDVLNKLPTGVKETIVTIALIVAVLGPILIIVGKVISAVGTIMTIIPKLAAVINVVKGAIAALNATMLANPIILIIAAIAALVAAFIYLWNNCEEFRQF